jgi:hypothetical protein
MRLGDVEMRRYVQGSMLLRVRKSITGSMRRYRIAISRVQSASIWGNRGYMYSREREASNLRERC